MDFKVTEGTWITQNGSCIRLVKRDNRGNLFTRPFVTTCSNHYMYDETGKWYIDSNTKHVLDIVRKASSLECAIYE